MITESQRKLWQTQLDFTEKSLERVFKDRTFLQLSATGVNMNLWWQKTCNKSLGWLLRSLNIPGDESYKELYRTLHGVEKNTDETTDRLRLLEDEVRMLRKKLNEKSTTKPAAKRRRSVAPSLDA